MNAIRGRVFVLGDDVDTDQILPGYAMAEPFDTLGKFAMAGVPELEFSKRVQPGDIIVAGRNFGCGSSREQAPIALKMAGLGLVVARSFARIFRRNAINIGLPVYMADILDRVEAGDEIEADLENGKIALKDGVVSAPPLSENVLRILEYGGLIQKVRRDLGVDPR